VSVIQGNQWGITNGLSKKAKENQRMRKNKGGEERKKNFSKRGMEACAVKKELKLPKVSKNE